MNRLFFAHAGEAHESSNESLIHYLGVWWIAILVFVIAVYVIGSLAYGLTKKSVPKTLIILMASFLIAGLTLYEKSPVISVLAILCGFVIAIGMTFATLMLPTKK